MQLAVRKVYKKHLSLDGRADILKHDSALLGDTAQYQQGNGSGPNSQDVHFDLNGTHNNKWNDVITGWVAEAAAQTWQAQIPSNRLEVPMWYWKEKAVQRFLYYKGYWTRSQQKMITANGENRLETAEEVLARINKHDNEENAKSKRKSRRYEVRAFFFCVC